MACRQLTVGSVMLRAPSKLSVHHNMVECSVSPRWLNVADVAKTECENFGLFGVVTQSKNDA